MYSSSVHKPIKSFISNKLDADNIVEITILKWVLPILHCQCKHADVHILGKGRLANVDAQFSYVLIK
jgi:hypothetical protein